MGPPPGSLPGVFRRLSLSQQGILATAVGIVVVAILVRTHRLSHTEALELALLFPSIILHEVSHGWVALRFGDDTAKRAGRLTLNPAPHISPLGTVIVPGVLLLIGSPVFGWARPVPVQVGRLRHPRNQHVLVALAGPGVNVALAVVTGLAFRFLVTSLLSPLVVDWPLWQQILYVGGYVNVLLAVFNLLPIPPLDGSTVLERFLPQAWLPTYYKIRPFLIVVVLFVALRATGALGWIDDRALELWAHLL